MTKVGLNPHAANRRSDRKSTRLNSSHLVISYAVFCLKKKKITTVATQDSPTDPCPLRQAPDTRTGLCAPRHLQERCQPRVRLVSSRFTSPDAVDWDR